MFTPSKSFKYPTIGLMGSFENNAAMSNALTSQLGSLRANSRKWGKTTNWEFLTKGVSPDWGKNAFRNVMQHYFDPVSKRLAKIQLIDNF